MWPKFWHFSQPLLLLTISVISVFQSSEIDIIHFDIIFMRVSFLANTDWQTVKEVDKNSVGFFWFLYHIQNINNICATEYANKTNISSSFVALIFAIIFLALLSVVLLAIGISLLCTIKSMSLKLKELQQQSPGHQRSK